MSTIGMSSNCEACTCGGALAGEMKMASRTIGRGGEYDDGAVIFMDSMYQLEQRSAAHRDINQYLFDQPLIFAF